MTHDSDRDREHSLDPLAPRLVRQGWAHREAPDGAGPGPDVPWYVSPECPWCRCLVLLEDLTDALPQHVAYMRWRDTVHPREYKCPHVVWWDIGYGWPFMLNEGPLAEPQGKSPYWETDAAALRLRGALARLARWAEAEDVDPVEVLCVQILGAVPPYANRDEISDEFPWVDLSPEWLTRVEAFAIHIEQETTDLGDEDDDGPAGMWFPRHPVTAYYVEEPTAFRRKLSVMLDRHAIKIERAGRGRWQGDPGGDSGIHVPDRWPPGPGPG